MLVSLILTNNNKIIPPIKNLNDVNCKGDQKSIAIFCGTKVEPQTNEAVNNKTDPLILDSDIKLNYLASFVSITFRPLYMPVLRSI